MTALKRRCAAAIDDARAEIEELNDRLLRTPETGFNEHRTAATIADAMRRLGLEVRAGLAGTGVKSRLSGRRPGPTVAIMGELDAMRSPAHPFADPITGAAHTCGHHAQLASMMAAAIGLAAVRDELDGDTVLFAVPAEECIEVDQRLALREADRLEFIVGKPELVRLGEFDDVDMALLTHTAGDATTSAMDIEVTLNGGVIKRATFRGVAAHAASAPWEGTNALKAATLASNAIESQRESFRDTDAVRIHWVMNGHGQAVSVVPDHVEMSLMVRARTIDGLRRASAAVDRSLASGAVAMGCGLEVTTVSGYLPFEPDTALADVVEANARSLVAGGAVRRSAPHVAGCSDVGDLAHLMPMVQPMAASGNDAPIHGERYWPTDTDSAVITPGKVMAATVIDLLERGAGRAREVLAGGDRLSRDEYLALRRSFDHRFVVEPGSSVLSDGTTSAAGQVVSVHG